MVNAVVLWVVIDDCPSAWEEIHEVFGDGHDYDWALLSLRRSSRSFSSIAPPASSSSSYSMKLSMSSISTSSSSRPAARSSSQILWMSCTRGKSSLSRSSSEDSTTARALEEDAAGGDSVSRPGRMRVIRRGKAAPVFSSRSSRSSSSSSSSSSPTVC